MKTHQATLDYALATWKGAGYGQTSGLFDLIDDVYQAERLTHAASQVA